jgi:hypothetical protein
MQPVVHDAYGSFDLLRGWDTLGNGALLNAAEDAGFELLLTPTVAFAISRTWQRVASRWSSTFARRAPAQLFKTTQFWMPAR